MPADQRLSARAWWACALRGRGAGVWVPMAVCEQRLRFAASSKRLSWSSRRLGAEDDRAWRVTRSWSSTTVTLFAAAAGELQNRSHDSHKRNAFAIVIRDSKLTSSHSHSAPRRGRTHAAQTSKITPRNSRTVRESLEFFITHQPTLPYSPEDVSGTALHGSRSVRPCG